MFGGDGGEAVCTDRDCDNMGLYKTVLVHHLILRATNAAASISRFRP